MSEIDSLRVTSQAELGSLETPSGVRAKRITVQEIRQLKVQTEKKKTLGTAILQVLSSTWKDVSAFFSFSKARQRGKSNCEIYGHRVLRLGNELVPRCANCGVVINSMDQLRSKL